jgi:hypothetical protein
VDAVPQAKERILMVVQPRNTGTRCAIGSLLLCVIAGAAQTTHAGSVGSVINFESAPLGNFASLGVLPGVTTTLSGAAFDSGIFNDSSDPSFGFNTTAGGSKYVRIAADLSGGAVDLTFWFNLPIDSFSLYITGAESAVPGTMTLNFDDGTPQSLPITKRDLPGKQLFGFFDGRGSITRVTLELTGPGRDFIGIDDVAFSLADAPVSTPLPSAATAGMVLLTCIGLSRSRRKAEPAGRAAWN